MAKNTKAFVQDFAFYEQLWEYYSKNRGKIRSRYNDLTKKFLAYNDSNENSDAFLREPQFEALEMYVLSRNLWIMPICIKCSMNGEKEKIDFQMRRIILFTKAVRGHF